MTQAADSLSEALRGVQPSGNAAYVYRPLDYARAGFTAYLDRLAPKPGRCRAVWLGMNPGPWGMTQTGVPFGEVAAVRDWMGIDLKIPAPPGTHPKRPVLGLACERSEVSGRRLWGLIAERFGQPSGFAGSQFIMNYCPLVFLGETGKNITPDKLPASMQRQIEQACDAHLLAVLNLLRPEVAVGVGAYARKQIERVLATEAGADLSRAPRVAQVLHPSPASPAANRGWAAQAERQLIGAGVWDARDG